MNARWFCGMACVACLFAASGVRADDEAQDESKASFWMQKKLEYSTQILAGLTSEDFEQVAKNARSMNALGHLEKWVRAGSADYRQQLRIFSSANRQLIAMADEKNLDGAAFAYVQLTLTCVNCHKLIRGPQGEPPAASK